MKGQMHFAQAVFADQVVFFGRKDCGFNTHVVRFHENNDNTYHPPQEERKQKIKCIIFVVFVICFGMMMLAGFTIALLPAI